MIMFHIYSRHKCIYVFSSFGCFLLFSFPSFSLWNLTISLSLYLCSIFPVLTYHWFSFISLYLFFFFAGTHVIWCCLYVMPEQNSCLLICKCWGFFLLYLQGNKMLLLPWCAATDTTCSPSLKHFPQGLLAYTSNNNFSQYTTITAGRTKQRSHCPASRTVTTGQMSLPPLLPLTYEVMQYY